VQVADLCGGSWPAALQIVAALYRRISRGQGSEGSVGDGSGGGCGGGGGGCVIDVSMTDGAHAMLALPLARHSIDGKSVADGVELLGGDAVPCYRVYACKGGTHVSVGALEPHFWARLCEAVGLEEHAKAGLVTGDAGVAVGEALQAKLMER
jgi:alpha-methylacyl-CoA racemase